MGRGRGKLRFPPIKIEREKSNDIYNTKLQMLLSVEQQQAFDQFKQGHNLVITGPGGVGKTKLISHFVEYANSIGTKIQVCAMTGCASLLLGNNAKTIHSWSGIKLGRGDIEQIVSQVARNKRAKKNWKFAKILIIDETSMMSKKIFDVLEVVARIVRGNNRPFGGIQIVFSADFYQLPPVPTPGEPETGEFCFESQRWDDVFSPNNHIELKTMFRQSDPKYIEILSQVRRGQLTDENAAILKTYVKREAPEGTVVAKLFPLRSRVDFVNKMMFDKIDEPAQEYTIQKRRDCLTYLETGKPIETAMLNQCALLTKSEIETELEQLITNTPCPEGLELKRGAAVMCCVNLDMDIGICNGSQGIVVDFVGMDALPVVRFSNGVVLTINRHNWQSDEFPTIAVSQFPLQLSWALTIHKIQGATLDMAQIDVGNGVFEYGQTYVALSRIRSLDGLYLANFNPGKIRAHPKVAAFYAGNLRFAP